MLSYPRALLAPLAALAFACGKDTDHGHDPGSSDHHDAEGGHDSEPEGHDQEGEHEHVHVAPHGGLLVPIGEEFAHVELTLDAESGRLTAYCLDHCAENPVRVSQGALELDLLLDGEEQRVVLEGVASSLTGETRSDTSEFRAVVPALKGKSTFEGTLRSITILGSTVEDLPIRPTG